MILEGIVGFSLIIFSTVAVTKFAMEVIGNPVLTEAEWEAAHGTRPLTDEEVAEL